MLLRRVHNLSMVLITQPGFDSEMVAAHVETVEEALQGCFNSSIVHRRQGSCLHSCGMLVHLVGTVSPQVTSTHAHATYLVAGRLSIISGSLQKCS